MLSSAAVSIVFTSSVAYELSKSWSNCSFVFVDDFADAVVFVSAINGLNKNSSDS